MTSPLSASAPRLTREQPDTDAPRCRDPHHEGSSEWCYSRRTLWHRATSTARWGKVKRVSFTPARIAMLYELIATEHAMPKYTDYAQRVQVLRERSDASLRVANEAVQRQAEENRGGSHV